MGKTNMMIAGQNIRNTIKKYIIMETFDKEFQTNLKDVEINRIFETSSISDVIYSLARMIGLDNSYIVFI